jgi:hypothetical protein
MSSSRRFFAVFALTGLVMTSLGWATYVANPLPFLRDWRGSFAAAAPIASSSENQLPGGRPAAAGLSSASPKPLPEPAHPQEIPPEGSTRPQSSAEVGAHGSRLLPPAASQSIARDVPKPAKDEDNPEKGATADRDPGEQHREVEAHTRSSTFKVPHHLTWRKLSHRTNRIVIDTYVGAHIITICNGRTRPC